MQRERNGRRVCRTNARRTVVRRRRRRRRSRRRPPSPRANGHCRRKSEGGARLFGHATRSRFEKANREN